MVKYTTRCNDRDLAGSWANPPSRAVLCFKPSTPTSSLAHLHLSVFGMPYVLWVPEESAPSRFPLSRRAGSGKPRQLQLSGTGKCRRRHAQGEGEQGGV